MRTRFDDGLQAQVTTDDEQRVRQINHFDQMWQPDGNEDAPARDVADAYLKTIAPQMGVPQERLTSLQERATFIAPRKQDVQYRLAEEKTLFDATTFGYVQTINNVPVWGSGMTVTVKHGPNRVVSATDTSDPNAQPATLPAATAVKRFVKLFATAETERAAKQSARLFSRAEGFAAEAAMVPREQESQTSGFIRGLVGRDKPASVAAAAATPNAPRDNASMIRGRFFYYRYDPAQRLPQLNDFAESEQTDAPPLPFDLDLVPTSIIPGQYYLCSEVTFSFRDATFGDIVWQALVEVETEAVLYIRPMAAGVTGMVFRVDPITASGDASKTPNQSDAVLNPFRTSVTLPNLSGPVGGNQSLVGARTALSEEETPVVSGPVLPSGSAFNFNVRTNHFAAVNAYYHTENFFQVLESLGFPLATYFNGTSFPLEVDHRGLGTIVNAHCVGNGTGGIDHCCYALDDSNTGQPLGIACDSRVHWHELGGHGVLYEHVNSPNFGFAHSAGDSMSLIFHDPDSKAPDRFLLAPFVPAVVRRCDRALGDGWAWGGVKDTGGYQSEQILATSLFRVYRAIGGDSTDINRRRFASRVTMYLILRAIGTLTPATNPSNVLPFVNALIAVDLLNWTSAGIFGGAYNKVIRWAFEKQGLFQLPTATKPYTKEGAPPAVDVYIDDGRAGEYQYQPVHWNTTTIWNRTAPDGGTTHQAPILGQTNFAYVRIKNRGTQTATNVKVRGFHCKPGAGLVWPTDLQAMITPTIAVGTLAGNKTQEKIVGPFQWKPITNAFGHDCLFMIVSAAGDPSNVDQFTAGETIPEWRLVPNDNNIGQRNVQPVPGGGGLTGLKEGLHGMSFSVRNPNNKTSAIQLKATLPPLLASKGWKVTFRNIPNGTFRLLSGARQDITIDVTPGQAFTGTEVTAARQRNIVIDVLADGIVVGGMTYPLDPGLKKAPIEKDPIGPV